MVPRFGIPDFGIIDTSTDLDSLKALSKTQYPVTEEGKKEGMLQFPYRKLTGSLMYLKASARPDLAQPLSVLSQYNENPGELVGMCDAAYACREDATSQGGYFFSIRGAAVSWRSSQSQQ